MFDEAYAEIDTNTRGVAVDPFDVRRGSDFQRCVPANVILNASGNMRSIATTRSGEGSVNGALVK